MELFECYVHATKVPARQPSIIKTFRVHANAQQSGENAGSDICIPSHRTWSRCQ